MATTVRDVMTEKPVAFQANTNLVTVARAMRDHDIGDVLVLRNGDVCGIVTDRDITVRAVAGGLDPNEATLEQVYSERLNSVGPDDPVEEAVELMRSKALRRLPVVEAGQVIGVVSIGDLALERDPSSALADISAAKPNV